MSNTEYHDSLVFRFGNGGALTQYSTHDLGGQYSVLSGYAGHVDGGAMRDAEIRIIGDGQLIFTKNLKAADPPIFFMMPVADVRQLRIEMLFPNEWGSVDYAVIAQLK